ncbi:biotin holocarboxylase synthetase [Actinomortierella ambigua]|uniref:Biotin holocarboxylase synthetase n=1 Tax=Actinomortierella ambigua TaxID=1343610 RepID=A0A9P6PQ37_9FUNG|nr:biotin holocarboxylase synthetase [Actinomortierella ambigua]
MNILVYSGEGTSRTSLAHTVNSLRALVGHHYDVMKIDAQGLLTEPWEESTSLLVMPGGRDLPYMRDLNGRVNTRIKEYVHNGGRYLGLCAGAYYASSRVVFEPQTPLEVIGDRELQFFGGECRGAVFPGFVYDSEKGANAVQIRLNKQVFEPLRLGFDETRVYFNGGGFFVAPEQFSSTTQVLAWYGDEDQQAGGGSDTPTPRAAIVACQVGRGLALLSGVHPEYDAAHLDARNPEYGPMPNVVSRLIERDAERIRLLQSLVKLMGLKLTEVVPPPAAAAVATGSDAGAAVIPVGAIMGIPSLTPLYLASVHPSLTADLARTLASMATPEGLIKEANDTFQLIPSPQHPIPEHTPTLVETSEGETEEQIIKNLVICPDQVPSTLLTPEFAMGDYFRHLQEARGSGLAGPMARFGSTLLYGQVVSSTQTMLDKNFGLCQHLPNGLVCNATIQVAGRGRGRNSWISPPGCLQFSMVLRHPVAARHASAVFVQYLVALAVVEAVRSRPGYEEIPMRLKWPNDIYAEAPLDHPSQAVAHESENGMPKMVKIGGVLVNSNFSGSEFLLVIGCGVNTTNPNPTTSVNHLIRYYNERHGTNLALFTQESLLARVLTKFEELYNGFLGGNGTGFAQFEQLYYRRWLHADALVTLTTETPHRQVRVKGITLDYGLLRTVAVDETGREVPGQEFRLQPDGNSFDMMKGLISQKS